MTATAGWGVPHAQAWWRGT